MAEQIPGEREPALPGAPEATEAQEGGEQQNEGLGPRQQRMATLMTRLATTARSFLLYDPGNEAIHRFLSILLDSFVSALRTERQIAFNVHPFELKFEGQTVYLNRDRERSLAFRLYRDGVRTLTFYEGFQWEELARLLEILSIRYTGVHQREDDMVTLLWKADFKHLEVQAVEGIVPDEEDGRGGAAASVAPAFVFPDDIDLPRPSLPPPKGPAWVAVPEDILEALRAEAWSSALPDDCLSLVAHLRGRLSDHADTMRIAEAAHVFAEMRDFLLAEDHLGSLKRFITALWQMSAEEAPAWDPGRHAVLYDLLDGCGDRRAVRRLLRSVPPDERLLRPELLEILDRSCPDPVAAVADALAEEQAQAPRAVARQILERYGAPRLEALKQRFLESSGQVASDLLRVIAGIGGEGATAFVAQQSAHPDPAVQDEALWHLEQMPYAGPVGHALLEALRRTGAQRRPRVIAMIARTKDVRFVEPLVEYVEERAGQLTTEEGARIGRILGTLGGEASIPRWQAWLKPSGVLRRGFEGPLGRQVAAALALSEIPGDAAAEALGAAFDHADEQSQPWILGALAQRQRSGRTA